MKRKFLIVAGLFISGLNPLWATSSQKITSDIKIKGNSSKSLSQNQKQQRVLYELNAPEDLFLPSRSSEVLVKTYQKVNLDQLENLLINNNRTIIGTFFIICHFYCGTFNNFDSKLDASKIKK